MHTPCRSSARLAKSSSSRQTFRRRRKVGLLYIYLSAILTRRRRRRRHRRTSSPVKNPLAPAPPVNGSPGIRECSLINYTLRVFATLTILHKRKKKERSEGAKKDKQTERKYGIKKRKMKSNCRMGGEEGGGGAVRNI